MMGEDGTDKSSCTRVPKPASTKTIEMFSPTPTQIDPTKQLELTLQKHNEMFDKILLAIQDSKEALETQIGAMQVETGLLRADKTKLAERVAGTESFLSSLRPTVLDVQTQQKDLRAEVWRLQDKAEDVEGRSR